MEKVTKYVNVYHNTNTKDLWTGEVYLSKQEAIDNIATTSNLTFLKTIEIQISPALVIE